MLQSRSFIIHVFSHSTGLNSCHLIALLVILLISFSQPNVLAIHESTKSSPGSNFAKGSIDLGGLIVTQTSSFNQILTDQDQGVETFYEPSKLPDGYFILGHYNHNNTTRTGRVLIVKDVANGAVAKPLSYRLLSASERLKTKQNGIVYVWEVVAPEGYMALGHIVTNTSKTPSFDKVRCVRSDFVEECSEDELLHCLRNLNGVDSSMPNAEQIKALMATYGPLVYFHPDERYLPSSVDWFFSNGALLYQRGNEGSPVRIDPTGSNLPQGGANDGTFWIDLPIDGNAKEHVMRGDLASVKGYLHVKAIQGGTMTDLALWLLYPYNGPATVKFLSFNIHLGRIGSHVSDWEHITLRINNLDGKLQSVFFGQHGGGQWVSASELEYTNSNKPVAYSSRNGHAMFPHGGLVVQGSKRIGVRNDMAKSNSVVDFGVNFEIISAEYLGIVEPPWLNYYRKWGPRIDYNLQDELKGVEKVLIINKLKREFEKFVNGLPSEVLGQDGPVGPKLKASWNGDE